MIAIELPWQFGDRCRPSCSSFAPLGTRTAYRTRPPPLSRACPRVWRVRVRVWVGGEEGGACPPLPTCTLTRLPSGHEAVAPAQQEVICLGIFRQHDKGGSSAIIPTAWNHGQARAKRVEWLTGPAGMLDQLASNSLPASLASTRPSWLPAPHGAASRCHACIHPSASIRIHPHPSASICIHL